MTWVDLLKLSLLEIHEHLSKNEKTKHGDGDPDLQENHIFTLL